MKSSSFDQTLAAARAGQAWACTRLYEDLKRPVVAYVRMRGAPDPDDVASEVFLCVFRDLGRFEGGEDDFRAWVFTIAHRRVLDDWRRRFRRPTQARLDVRSAQVVGGDAQEEAMAELSRQDVDTLLGRLTVEQRDVVLLHVVADLPIEQVAQVMGRSVSAVRSLQHRAVTALRKAVPAPPDTDPSTRAIWLPR